MDIKQIQELIKLATKSGISELQVKEGDHEVTIKCGTVYTQGPVQQMPAMVHQVMAPAMPHAMAETMTDAPKSEKAEPKSDNAVPFKSPMIGTFYRKPGPDKPLFVQVGDTIKKGDVLCIIEAMKLFNEIEFDGENSRVVKILVEDNSPVEYDQPLFLLEKI